MTALVLCALLLDQLLGEPERWHPLVGFGWLANRVESMLNTDDPSTGYVRGIIALTILVIPFVVLAFFLTQVLGEAFAVLVLMLSIGAKSLIQHAHWVADALKSEDLQRSRAAVARIVSRDTDSLNRKDIITAAIESLLENGADALFGALFWFLVAGAPGVVCYRLVNTLDAMWGYRTPRYGRFGWAAARLDDLMNWLPARLTALSYALSGDVKAGLLGWWRDASLLESPNGGVVMATGGGALGIKLGGPTRYHGVVKEKPWFGGERSPDTGDIFRSMDLIHRATLWWIVVLFIGELAFA